MAKSRIYRWQNFGQQARKPAPVRRKKVSPAPRAPKKPTPAQLGYLKVLCNQSGCPVPSVTTRREAYLAISALKARLPTPPPSDRPEEPDFV